MDKKKIIEKLEFIYGTEDAKKCYNQIIDKINNFNSKPKVKRKKFYDEKDCIFITYADQFKAEGETPLTTLARFSDKFLKDKVSSVHFLPFFPYSSDDGFSVIDYYNIGSQFGTWDDLHKFNGFRFMFDFVCNHISSQSEWFLEYLKGNDKYKDYFIEANPNLDYSMVVRPRALPLLTKFNTSKGEKYIWTTFSTDQIDLNLKSTEVLLECIDILLYYVEKGADMIRLDAVGYLWKELGTTCIHLPQTHTIIKLLHDILELTAKEVVLITETNVPHKDNISYLGDGTNEAGMVYQFALPPLTLYTMLNEDVNVLADWASGLEQISDETTYFNFLASHDGIGVNPARGIISEDEINNIIQTVKNRGGLASYKNNADGTQSVYELNISYFNAINNPNDDIETKVKRFTAAYAISCALMGVPGIYVHSLIGSENYYEGVKLTGMNRTINREKLLLDNVSSELQNSETQRSKVYNSICKLLELRKNESAFSPIAKQTIFKTNNSVLSLIRENRKTNEKIIVLQNVANKKVSISFDINSKKVKDILTGNIYECEQNLSLELEPFQTIWLKEIKY